MNKDELKKLLKVPTLTYHEDRMVAYLRKYLAEKPVAVFVDHLRNVFVIKGDNGKPLPCLAAHIDSVQPMRKITVVEDGDYLQGAYGRRSAGLGADDKTGIHVCLELLDRFDHIALAFFSMEEHGAQGAKGADPEFFQRVGYLIEYDCPSRQMVSYSSGGVRLFADDGDFIKTALPVLQQHGSVLWQHHPYTDVMAVRRRFPISCLNLSSGYYNWHQSNEFVKLSDVDLAIEQGEDLVRALDSVAYPCPQYLAESTPLIPIGPLMVPAP